MNNIINYSTYSKKGITKIKDTTLLNDTDLESISSISNELQRVFEVKQIFRTETEIRYSVLNDTKFPTVASKYWQSIREQNLFFTELINLSLQYEELQGELELEQALLDELLNDNSKIGKAKQKIKNAQIKRKEFGLMEIRLEASDRVREIMIWEKVKEELKQKEEFNIDDVNEHQAVSYMRKWENEMELGKLTGNMDMYRNGHSQLSTIKKDSKRELE